MRTDRPVTIIQFYKKTVLFLLAILFTFSLLVIALDQHFYGFSPTCLICRTKSSINNIDVSSFLESYPTITYFVLDEFQVKVAILVLSPFQNKSPPLII